MGQYHTLYNVDKKQKVDGLSGYKLLEQIGYPKSTATALLLLIANSNGRGGGDVEEHPLVGSWAGDRVVMQGDYAEEGDQAFIANTDEYEDVTKQVFEMLNCTLTYYQENMTNHPFNHWYAIVDYRCWYIGYFIDRKTAQEEAIKQFNVQLSKAGYCIVNYDSLKVIFDSIKVCLEQDKD